MAKQASGDLAGALQDFNQAVQIKSDYAEAYANRASTRQALHDWAGAVADLTEALHGLPEHVLANLYHNRGAARIHLDDASGALADYDESLRRDPKRFAPYEARGSARTLLNDFDGALAYFGRALELAPPHAKASIYHNRGGMRIAQREFAKAVADFNEALRLNPRMCGAYISRGNARYHLRDPRALEDFERAFGMDAALAARELVRSLQENLKRDKVEVLANCRKHLRLDPNDACALARRGLSLVLLGREAEAKEDLMKFRNAAVSMRTHLDVLLRGLAQNKNSV